VFIITPRDQRFNAEWHTKTYMFSALGYPGISLKLIPFFLVTVRNILISLLIHFREKPDIVIGFGGYVSLAPLLTGKLLGKKLALNEQNTVPGKVNRMCARWASVILTGLPGSEQYWHPEVRGRIFFSGIPVRVDAQVRTDKTSKPNLFTILVVGGSQGARYLNTVMVEAVGFLSSIKQNIFVIHLSGNDDPEPIRQAYESGGIRCECYSFFEKMGELYSQTDMALCRAGAGTLSELSCAGIPAIVIPFPHATDNHQYWNGDIFRKAGAAELIDQQNCSAKLLAEKVIFYYNNRDLLKTMKNNMLKCAEPNAGKQIARKVMELVT
jgi:UDP-N-acetylglucosamine--N-acetylmuramyl-(pentapeptide) pyrophosphoryl-undecaprenol N-acetylglucosamine transferase